jgi:hypothetical protein
MRRVLLGMLAFPLLSGCAAWRQLDEWSRPGVRYVETREIWPAGLPAAGKRRGYVDKFIIYSEVPVQEFYGLPYYTSSD